MTTNCLISASACPDDDNNNGRHNGHWGSTTTIKDALATALAPLKKPTVNMDFIQSIALTQGIKGEPSVRNYHDKLFIETTAEQSEISYHLMHQVESDIVGIQKHIQDLSAINLRTKRYQELHNKSIPWTRFAEVQIVLLMLVSVILLAVGINTIAQVLFASGIPGFDNPWRCYLFTFIPAGLPFVIKYLGMQWTDPSSKKTYTVMVWILGLISGIIWVRMFSVAFPSLTQSASAIINSLAQGQAINGNDLQSSGWFITVTIFTEALLAAGCWLSIDAIVDKHQPSVRVDNPAFIKTQEDHNHQINHHREQVNVLGQLRGRIHEIEEGRQRFILEAVGLFHAAVAASAPAHELSRILNHQPNR
jgi:hypothetical protein